VSWFRAPGNADKMKKDEQGTLSLQWSVHLNTNIRGTSAISNCIQSLESLVFKFASEATAGSFPFSLRFVNKSLLVVCSGRFNKF
jgi:hypothetical protein